jgi:hypothetical protein
VVFIHIEEAERIQKLSFTLPETPPRETEEEEEGEGAATDQRDK